MAPQTNSKKLHILKSSDGVEIPFIDIDSINSRLCYYNFDTLSICNKDVITTIHDSLIGKIIVIEGSISAGKTTLLRSIKSIEALAKKYNIEMNIKIYKEYTSNELLKIFVDDMKTNAFAFQLFMLNKRQDAYRDAILEASKGSICFMDRSILGDSVFASLQYQNGNISDEQFNAYLSEVRQYDTYQANLIVYLDSSPEECFKRKTKRGNQSENGYTLEYFEHLDEEYKKVFSNAPPPKIMIDWSKNRISDENIKNNDNILTNNISIDDCITLLKTITLYVDNKKHVPIEWRYYD